MELLARVRARAPRGPEPPDSGIPVPPPDLRFSVAGTQDRDWFLASGRAGAESLRELLDRARRPIHDADAMLDFGCGCGRVIRHFADLRHVAVHGTDVHKRAIAWCRDNLSFAQFERNGLAPPSPYGDDTFDFVYALSVFTHLPESLQFSWMREFRRILRRGGLLALTTHGESYLDKFSEKERQEFRAGQLAVRRGRAAGSNRCAALHPESWVRERLANGFDVLEFLPEGARGNPTQDLYLLRRH